jgi:hypothetical protein
MFEFGYAASSFSAGMETEATSPASFLQSFFNSPVLCQPPRLRLNMSFGKSRLFLKHPFNTNSTNY